MAGLRKRRGDSREYDFFSSILSSVVAPDLPDFAVKALGKRLITQGNCSDALNERNSAENRASSLLP